MFKRKLSDNGALAGFEFETDRHYFFFGSRHSQDLPKQFPNWKFAYLKQVHGRDVIQAQPEHRPEADGQFTQDPGVALISQSADCVPVLLASQNQVCAIHSGWRGSAQNIIKSAKSVFAQEPVLFAAIGPHILRQSFEVGKDVAHQLLASAPAGTNRDTLIYPHNDPAKFYFDLTQLIRLQIQEQFGSRLRLLECLGDTKTSPDFHSFRRDREQAQRQFSFVVIKS